MTLELLDQLSLPGDPAKANEDSYQHGESAAVVMDGAMAAPLMEVLLKDTQAAMAHYAFDGMHQPRLLMGKVGSHARALGAALLPLHSQFFPDKDIFLKRDLV